jgi:hypothetical protein
VLALLLAALNAAILLTVTTPQAAAAPLETGQNYAGGQAAPKIAGVPALAGRAHNAAAIIALREKAAGATRYQPVMFALLLMQALVMGATTFYLWNRAGRVFAPGGRSRANRGSETIRRRSDLSRSADGYARG